mmetsp:Transcript_15843/g.24002  ORF Transcript_15843/g.24002 Transcript_15843/m.24002 type:complete len:264 (+) Transcript_15843:93-884(+)
MYDIESGEQSASSNTFLIGINLLLLLVDFVVSLIGTIAAFVNDDQVTCCGKDVRVTSVVVTLFKPTTWEGEEAGSLTLPLSEIFYSRETLLWLSITYMILIVLEAYITSKKDFHWITYLNPYFGFILTVCLLVQSNRTEAIVALVFECIAYLLHVYHIYARLKFPDVILPMIIVTLPSVLTLGVFYVYIRENGTCLILSDPSKLLWTLSGYQDPCFICEGDGLPYTLDMNRGECFSDDKSSLIGENGNYCDGDLADTFCFYAY